MKEERNQANGIAIPNDFDDQPAELLPEAIVEEARVSVTEFIERPPEALTIDDAIITTIGNFCTISGKAKSKKTTFLSMMIAASVNGQYNKRLKAPLPDDKKRVLLIDTEQGRWHVQGVVKRVHRLTGMPMEMDIPNLETYCLRKYSTTERLQVIEHLLDKYSDLGIVYLDGVRDIVFSINDETEATETASRLLRWTEEKKIALVCVLHQNKGDTNVRGHLGTELMNKSESVISITKDKDDKDRSIVEADYVRNEGFEPFAFRFNDTGIPVFDTNWNPASVERKITRKPVDCPLETQIKILSDLKKHLPEKPSYKDLVEQMTVTVSNLHLPIGENIAKEYITFFSNDGQISKIGKARSRSAHYIIGGQNEG